MDACIHRPPVRGPESWSPFGGRSPLNTGRRSPESMTARAVLLPERFRAGCAFGAGPVLTGPVSPTGQIEVGIVRPPQRRAKRQHVLAAIPAQDWCTEFAFHRTDIAAIALYPKKKQSAADKRGYSMRCLCSPARQEGAWPRCLHGMMHLG